MGVGNGWELGVVELGVDLLQDSPKPKELVSASRFVAELTQEQPGREPCGGGAMTAMSEGEEMPREVPVDANARKAVNARVVGKVPAPFGHRARNRRIQHRQLVHQFTSALYEHLLSKARRHLWLIGAREYHPVVFHPPEKLRRRPVRAHAGAAGSQLTADRCRQRLGQYRVGMLGPEVTAERPEILQPRGGRDDHRLGLDDAVTGRDFDVLPSHADAFDRRALVDPGAAR